VLSTHCDPCFRRLCITQAPGDVAHRPAQLLRSDR
jgi:hypothetical protein